MSLSLPPNMAGMDPDAVQAMIKQMQLPSPPQVDPNAPAAVGVGQAAQAAQQAGAQIPPATQSTTTQIASNAALPKTPPDAGAPDPMLALMKQASVGKPELPEEQPNGTNAVPDTDGPGVPNLPHQGGHFADALNQSTAGGNPLGIIGGLINGISPEGKDAQGNPVSATNDPNSFISKILGLIPPVIAPHTVGAVEGLLGLTPAAQTQAGGASYYNAGMNKNIPAEDVNDTNQKFSEYQADLKLPQNVPFIASKTAAAKDAFDAAKARDDQYGTGQQQLGQGTSEQSAAFNTAKIKTSEIGQAEKSIDSALQAKDAKGNITADPIEVGSKLKVLAQYANIPNDPATTALMSHATDGKLFEYLASIGPVAAQKVMGGILNAAADSAAIPAEDVHRYGQIIYPNAKDPNSEDNAKISKLDPDWNDPNNGLVDPKQWQSDVANAIGPMENAGTAVNRNISTQTAASESDATTAHLGELAKTLPANAGNMVADVLNFYSPGTGDKLKNLMVGNNKPKAPSTAPANGTPTTFIPDAGKFASASTTLKNPDKYTAAQVQAATNYVKQYEATNGSAK